ncbi:MAG: MBL fold metallo-hydrolase [Caulobacteraceae bacterium]
MEFKRLPLGIYQANCYIVNDEKTEESAVIDPGGEFEEIRKQLEANKLKVKYIILTHAHGDHIGALEELKEYSKAPVCLHKQDLEMLRSSKKNLSSVMGYNSVEMEGDRLLDDGEVLVLGDTKLEIIHTPGHSEGSICVKCENVLFSGDTLFARSIGRTDLEGGSYEAIIESIKSKLLVLAGNTVVYPGHGGATTINDEKNNNPFLQ